MNELGPPLYAMTNIVDRWFTTDNYDLLIYPDKLVAVRRRTAKELREHVAGLRAELRAERQLMQQQRVLPPSFREPVMLPSHPKRTLADAKVEYVERDRARVQSEAGQTLQQLLASDDRNRVMPIGEIRSARFRRTLVNYRLDLTLQEGERAAFFWPRLAARRHLLTPDPARAKAALERALGPKLGPKSVRS